MKQYTFLIESFNKDSIPQLNNYKDLIEYCDDNFKEVVGIGSCRKVYKIPDENCVLKVATHERGIRQNESEWKIYNQYKKSPILTKCLDIDKKGLWVKSEWCFINAPDDRDENLKNIKRYIQKITGLDYNMLQLLAISCLNTKSINTIVNNKEVFIDYFNYIKNNSESLKKLFFNSESYLDIILDKHDKMKKIYLNDDDLFFLLNFCVLYIDKKFNVDKYINILESKFFRKIDFLKHLELLGNKVGYRLRDAMCAVNMGIVKRSGKDYIVLLDYGF